MNIPYGSRGIVIATANFTEEQQWGRERDWKSNRDKQVQNLLKPFRYFGQQGSFHTLWTPEKWQVDVAHVFYEQNNSIGWYWLDAFVNNWEVHQYEEGDFNPKEVIEDIFRQLVFRRATIDERITAMAYLVGDLWFRKSILDIFSIDKESINITDHEDNQVLLIQWNTRSLVVELYEKLFPDDAEIAKNFGKIWSN